MSTFSFLSTLRKGAGFAGLFLLSGLLIALQFLLPSSALAAPRVSSYSFGASQTVDKAGVSVVRVVVSYLSVPPLQSCTLNTTGLGVLVGSWPTNPGSRDITNWILTDGALVNPVSAPCTSGKATLQLAGIQILASSAYSATSPSFILKSLHCQQTACSDGTASGSIQCQSAPTCAKGTVLIPFHTTNPQPFMDLATADPTAQSIGIELAALASGLPSPLATPNPQLAAQLLTPTAIPSVNLTDATNEVGMPTVNSNGQLEDMKTQNVDTAQSIRDFVTKQIAPLQATNSNNLHDAWNQGIKDFYVNSFVAAKTDFTSAQKLNSQFQAPTAFLQLPPLKALAGPSSTPGAQKTPTSRPSAGGVQTPAPITIGPFTIPAAVTSWLPWLLGGVVLLLLILLLLALWGINRQMHQRREYARINRKAEEDAKLIAKQEQEELQRKRQGTSQPAPVKSTVNLNHGGTPDLRCPNCGEQVKATDNFCSQCRMPLTLSDSGLNVRLKLPKSPQLADAGNIPPPPPPLPIYDQPTREMSPDQVKNGQEELDKTAPYAEVATVPASSLERFSGKNLSLLVGTRSNPGIKRQHKPNEDSLFAAQGERIHDSQPEQFGVFVVADGMGGHSKGQDASRLAIQTISEVILPRLSSNEPLSDDALIQLLVDGVQSANVAVHQRNMENRADMGTTMTAALIVGATAYIANVGDSRTYLYRKPEGLQKVTNDHSVVASLVDAGIIKPDDIYTHPKRNQIYRSLGEKPVVEVDSFKVALMPGDKLLLCSDGLWDMVRDPAIEKILSMVPDPSQTGNALIKAALEGGGEDNVSVIVVHITESTQRTGMTNVELLARPEAPQYPPM